MGLGNNHSAGIGKNGDLNVAAFFDIFLRQPLRNGTAENYIEESVECKP